MEITALEPRRHRLVQLFLDGEPAVKLDEETAASLRPGQQLSDEELHELIARSDAVRAKEKALYLLEHRPHSKRELEDKLARTVGREAAGQAAGRMEELGLIDDADYARRLAEELARKGFAAPRIRQELLRRGIDRELAAQEAERAAAVPEDALHSLIERRFARQLGEEKGRRRAVAALQRMGYRWEEIRSALRAFGGEPED